MRALAALGVGMVLFAVTSGFDGVIAVLILFVLAAATEVFRATTRRRLIEEFVADKGWTLKSCQYTLRLLSPNWLINYEVEVIDETGRELHGIAHATGFLRRKVWIDW